VTEEQNDIVNAVFSNGTLMNLQVGKWSGTKRMRPTDLLLDDARINEDRLNLGFKRLLPVEDFKKFTKIEGEARAYLYSHSLDFPIAGARFVSYKALKAILDKVREFKERYNRVADDLISRYDLVKSNQLTALDEESDKLIEGELKKVYTKPESERVLRYQELEEWRKLQRRKHESAYPAILSLREKFYFGWQTFEIKPSSGAITEIEAEAALEAREKLNADLTSWVKSASIEMHQVLGNAAKNCLEQMKKHGKVNPKNLKPLIKAFESFKAMDFTGKSEFHDKIERIRKEFLGDGGVETGAVNVNSTDTSKRSFTELVEEVAKLASDDVAGEAAMDMLGSSELGMVID